MSAELAYPQERIESCAEAELKRWIFVCVFSIVHDLKLDLVNLIVLVLEMYI